MKEIFYTNKRNENKHLVVHHSDCGHYTVTQFMKWGDVVNWTGARRNRRKLRRWKVKELNELLNDYEEVKDE